MKIQRRNKANPEFSLAAMVDVILLLLIFFMVTSAASNVSQIDVKLPKADVQANGMSDQLAVSVSADGTYFVDEQPVAKDQMEARLSQALQQRNSTSFLIRADENTRHRDVVFLMELAEKHHYNIGLATLQPEK